MADIQDELPDGLDDEAAEVIEDEGDGSVSSSSVSITKTSSSVSVTKTSSSASITKTSSSSSSVSATKSSSSSESSWSSFSITKTSSSLSVTKTSSSSSSSPFSPSSSSSSSAESASSSSSLESVTISQSSSLSVTKTSSSLSVSGSDSSASVSKSSWSGSLSQSVAMGGEGITYGAYRVTAESVFSWDAWKYKESGAAANYTDIWGRLEMESGEEFVSPVVDMGDASSKLLSLKFDYYSPGYGQVVIEWRGSSEIFNQWDDEITGPGWVPYVGDYKTWRYMQLKLGAA